MNDYHIHTPLCHHAIGTPLQYLQAAEKLGLTEIGFADHNPMPAYFDQWRMSVDDLPRYIEMIEETQSSSIPVRIGLECDYIRGYESWIEQVAAKYPWDYLIGSVHYISPGWAVDDPQYLSRFTDYPVEEIWDLYWKHYLEAIKSELFDFVAHPDLPKKFGYRPKGDLGRYYEPAIRALVDHRLAYEINTAGLRKEAEEIYPAYAFIELAGKAGVPVLINSDAHAPEEVGHQFGFARELARKAGYNNTVRFEKRRRIETDF